MFWAAAERDDEELSDLSDDEVQEFFYTAQESAAKKQCWDAANHDWVEKAQLKAEAAARQVGISAATLEWGLTVPRRSIALRILLGRCLATGFY